MTTTDKLVAWIKSHPGFYVSHDADSVTLQIEWINTITGERGIDYEIVHNITEARTALGY
jgi:hypothetical protein